MGAGFELEILRQGWIDAEVEEHDLCSHGAIHLQIGGEVIVTGADGEYGISEGALALLRTLSSEHSPDQPVAERLIPHGCGAILMMTCPIGVDWELRHVGERVSISNVTVYPTTATTDAISRPEAATDLPRDEYRRVVVGFARKAKTLFDDFGPKLIDDEWDRQQYVEFWTEFDALMARHAPSTD